MDRYSERINLFGTSQRERDLNRLKQSLIKDTPQSLSCKSVSVDGATRSLIIDTSTKPNLKEIKTLPNETISVGQTVLWNGTYYLVTEADSDEEVYVDGIMELCNYTLKFQSPTGTILSYPCITSNKTSGDGENSDKLMTLGDGMKSVKIPYDESTILLHNDEDKTYRFFLDRHPTRPIPYKLTFADTTSNHYGDSGIIELIVKEDQISPTDRIDLGICDYFTPDVIPVLPDPDVPTEIITITSDAQNNEVILGIEHTFNATFKNELGVDITNVVAVYSVDNIYGGKVVLVDNGDGTATVKVGTYKDNYLCTEQFTLRCYDATHGFDSTVLLTIVGMY